QLWSLIHSAGFWREKSGFKPDLVGLLNMRFAAGHLTVDRVSAGWFPGTTVESCVTGGCAVHVSPLINGSSDGGNVFMGLDMNLLQPRIGTDPVQRYCCGS
ncbi:MAG TPA: hypothetical protein PK336_09250, partial [Methanoculleus sp.]|nr:hypothetical protein [Methanoculleus sp.]